MTQGAIEINAAINVGIISNIGGAVFALPTGGMSLGGAMAIDATGAAVITHGLGVSNLASYYLSKGQGSGGNKNLSDLSNSNKDIADKIANGHAYEKHIGEFKSLGIESKNDFANHIESVMNNPTAIKQLKNGTAYVDKSTGTVIIHNPNMADRGTSYVRQGSQQSIMTHFDSLK